MEIPLAVFVLYLTVPSENLFRRPPFEKDAIYVAWDHQQRQQLCIPCFCVSWSSIWSVQMIPRETSFNQFSVKTTLWYCRVTMRFVRFVKERCQDDGCKLYHLCFISRSLLYQNQISVDNLKHDNICFDFLAYICVVLIITE